MLIVQKKSRVLYALGDLIFFILFFLDEHVLADSADGANPVFW